MSELIPFLLMIALCTLIAWHNEIDYWIARRCAFLLADANSCGAEAYLPWKRYFFYPFKKRLLRSYGTFVGYARQEVEKGECYACNNYWEDTTELCPNCAGTGIYKELYFLNVYRLGRLLFMVPAISRRDWNDNPEPIVMEVKGRLLHPEIPIQSARKAMIILFLLFDVWGFLWHALRELHNSIKKRSWLYRAIFHEITAQVWDWQHIVRRDERGWMPESYQEILF